MGSYKCCLCFTRKFRWVEVEPPADVKEAFAEYAEGGPHMNAKQLRQFLADAQGDAGATAADAERVMEQVRQLRNRHTPGKLSKPLLALNDFHQSSSLRNSTLPSDPRSLLLLALG